MSSILQFILQTSRHVRRSLLLVLTVSTAACGALASKEETGVIIARRAQIRSSTAVVAADLKEVVRNEVVDILDSNTAENGESWLLVRTRDAENTEGWIEARNVMPQEMLERARQLAKEDEGLPAQATGQLRASTNIRLSPDRTKDDNILMKLESGARFEIVGWKRVAKTRAADTAESDDVPKPGAAPANDAASRREGDEAKLPEETTELWYKVRLANSTSPAPAAWVYGKQVELTVPSDIIFYRTGREFVAWQRLDDEDASPEDSQRNSQDTSRDAQPGSWVILEKSSAADANKLDSPDFDRIYVLGYDKDRQEHYTVYRSPDLEGFLPLRLEGKGDSKTFAVRLKHDGELKDARYRVITDDRGLLRVEPLDEAAKSGRKR
ncbi:MAG TPA: hypothetical protein VGB73_00415 [Pyrinomonadaceae bacterium]|jgi:hypothetical protein